MKLLGVNQKMTVPYSPSTNGAIEQVNGTLLSILKKLSIDHPTRWDKFLFSAIFAYRISHHQAIQYSSFKALYGKKPVLPIQVFLQLYPLNIITLNDFHSSFYQNQFQVSENLYATKTFYDK